LVRRLFLPLEDPRLARLAELHKPEVLPNGGFYSYWDIERTYEQKELVAAEFLNVWPSRMFEPAGEDCGTKYDYSAACPVCGAGRAIASPLRLAAARLPKRVDLAFTIARDECIVSERFAGIVADAGLTGLELRPVEWISRGRAPKTLPQWFQMVFVSRRLRISPETSIGNSPWRIGSQEGRCPLGDTLGLRVCSELYVRCEDWDSSDFVQTEQYVNRQSGLVMPFRLVVLSQRAYRTLDRSGIRGWKVEIARCGGAEGPQ
jgi:hypothetical protein